MKKKILKVLIIAAIVIALFIVGSIIWAFVDPNGLWDFLKS